MNRIKRFISILLSSAMTLGVIAAAPFSVSAEGNEHTHTHDGVSFTEWTASDSLPPQEGSYCLMTDVTLNEQWTVPSGETNLCLNGHIVKQTGTGERVVFIGTGRTLSLYDCGEGGKITGGSSDDGEGSGIFVDKMASLNIYGGSITGNNSPLDEQTSAAVYISQQATVTMNGGSISDNYFGYMGGGVFVGNGAYFSMNGGRISDNQNTYTGDFGGGVYVFENGTFIMNDGEISGNAADNGGGVYLDDNAVFIMNGGSIIDNEADTVGGGVYASDDSEISISGDVSVTNNTVQSDPSNIWLADTLGLYTIFITGELGADASIGVSSAVEDPSANPVVFTDGLSGNGGAGNFTSDNNLYDVLLNDEGEAALGEEVTISFEKGDSEAQGSMDPVEWIKGTSYRLPQCGFTPGTDKVFAGWKAEDSDRIYQPNDSYSVTGDVTFTAVYNKLSAWSYLQTQIDTLPDGVIIMFQRNYTAGENDTALVIPEGKSIVIDLNDHTIDRNLSSAAENGNVITNNGTLTIQDSGFTHSGTITGGFNTVAGGGIVNNGSLTVKGGTITGNQVDGYYGGGAIVTYQKYFAVSGLVNITGNKSARTDTENNVFLNDFSNSMEDRINIVGYLNDDSRIGVTSNYPQGGQFITRGLSDKAVAENFVSDNADYGVIVRNGEAKLSKYYTVSFEASGGSGDMADIRSAEPDYVLPTCDFTAPDGFKFKCWSINGTEYAAGASVNNSLLNDITAVAVWERKLFAGHSLSLNGSIGVNFYLNITAEQAAKTSVSFSWLDKTFTDDTPELDPCGSGYYMVSCPIAAAEMTCGITAVATIDKVVQDETSTYSAVTYANKIMTDQSFRAKYIEKNSVTKYDQLVTLVQAMLDYGSKAQVRFDRNIENLANGGTDYFTGEVTLTSGASDMEENLLSCGLEYVGTSVIYLSQTTLRHYYRIVEPNKFTNEIKNGITLNGESVNYGEKNGMIYFDKKDIAASQMDTEYMLKINGHEYHYSALDYSAMEYSSDDKPYSESITKQLAASVYRYNQAANVFFGD